MSGVPALEADHISFSYADGTVALRDVSVHVVPGEVVAVLGASGAGKSTLFRCLAGLERPSGGAVRLSGVDLVTLSGNSRRRTLAQIGLVFQEFHLVGRTSVLSNVLIGRLAPAPVLRSLVHISSASDRRHCVELLVRLGLGEQVRKRADALSGGQRQRVALARALAQEPTVLLADEPVANLDPTLAAGVVDDIVRLVRAEGLACILNLHDVHLARRVADRIVGMRAGQVKFDLPAGQVTDVVLDDLYRGAHHTAPQTPDAEPHTPDTALAPAVLHPL